MLSTPALAVMTDHDRLDYLRALAVEHWCVRVLPFVLAVAGGLALLVYFAGLSPLCFVAALLGGLEVAIRGWLASRRCGQIASRYACILNDT